MGPGVYGAMETSFVLVKLSRMVVSWEVHMSLTLQFWDKNEDCEKLFFIYSSQRSNAKRINDN